MVQTAQQSTAVEPIDNLAVLHRRAVAIHARSPRELRKIGLVLSRHQRFLLFLIEADKPADFPGESHPCTEVSKGG